MVNVSYTGHMAEGVQSGNYGFESGHDTLWAGCGQSKAANICMANEIENRYGTKGLRGLSYNVGGSWIELQNLIPEKTMQQWEAWPNADRI